MATIIKVNGQTITIANKSSEAFDIVKASAILDTSLESIQQNLNALKVVSNVKAMEAFGYQATEGFADKLKSGIKTVFQKIKEFFKKLIEFIKNIGKWIARLFSKFKFSKKTEKVLSEAVNESKSPEQIGEIVIDKVVEESENKDLSVLNKVNTQVEAAPKFTGEPPAPLTFSNGFKPDNNNTEPSEDLTEDQANYNAIYSLYSAKVGAGGNVGYSDEFAEMAYYVALIKWTDPFVKDYKDILGEFKDSISSYDHDLEKEKDSDNQTVARQEKVFKRIESLTNFINNAIKETREKISDKYSNEKKDILFYLSKNGYSEKIKDIESKIEYLDSIVKDLEKTTDECSFGSSTTKIFGSFFRLITNTSQIYKSALDAIIKVTTFVNKTNAILSALDNAPEKDSTKLLK